MLASTKQTKLLQEERTCFVCIWGRHAGVLVRCIPYCTPRARSHPTGMRNRLSAVNDFYRACKSSSTCKSDKMYRDERKAIDKELAKGIKIGEGLGSEKKAEFRALQAKATDALAALDKMYTACAATPSSCVDAKKFDAKVKDMMGLKASLERLQPDLGLTHTEMEARRLGGQLEELQENFAGDALLQSLDKCG